MEYGKAIEKVLQVDEYVVVVVGPDSVQGHVVGVNESTLVIADETLGIVYLNIGRIDYIMVAPNGEGDESQS